MSKRTSEDAPQEQVLQAKKGKMASNGATAPVEIDEDLHSRQLAVYGRGAMRRMAAADVLVIGLNGLGVEVAKNVILAGVRSVSLLDGDVVQARDLGSQFYLSEEDVGARTRAEACRARLAELNTSVEVSVVPGGPADLPSEALVRYSIVVAIDVPLAEALRLDEAARAASAAFIRADVRGVFGTVFTDFGSSFEVEDVDGEQPNTGIVASITTGPTTLVTAVEDERLSFEDGQYVHLSELVGIPELAAIREPIRVKNCRPGSLELEVDSTDFSPHVRGGIVTQVKMPKTLSFKPLAESLEDPGEFLLTDFSKLERPVALHVGFRALDAFRAERGRLPGPWSAADADALVELARGISAKTGAAGNEAAPGDVDETVLRALAGTAGATLNPMAATLGGVVGQEVVKAASGKFTPIHQWFHCDAMESLPAEADRPSEEEAAPAGTRYDDLVAVYGRRVRDKLADLRLFLVGAGALGCEFAKNLALLGVATGPEGLITLTDDDTIERSNLSRQFLFRDRDIGRSKSEAAAAAAARINPAVKIRALQNRAAPSTEDVFDDAFWESLDVVVNALDNVQARLYVDARCVYFAKPLLESGTLGPKINTQCVIPGLTENYGASRDPPEKQAPMCTLHSFPHSIDHCLTYARSEFEGLFEKLPADVNSFLKDPEAWSKAALASTDAGVKATADSVARALGEDRCQTFSDCVAVARRLFDERFHDRVAQLVHTFPEDAVTSTGAPFWSPPKRFPHAISFDGADPSHAELVQAAALLLARTYGVEVPAWAEADALRVGAEAAKLETRAFTPDGAVKIETDPTATAPSAQDVDEAALESTLAKAREAAASLPPGFSLAPQQFEKDDDSNGHMQLVAGMANMRARSYGIQEVDRLQAKLIAGKIVPAIATATAMATGLVCLELFKFLQSAPLEAYRNTFANLAVPLIASSEPVPPKKTVFGDLSWTLWDRWTLEGDLTVSEVLAWFEPRGLEAYSISCGAALLYNTIFPRHKERLGKKMSELVVTVAKVAIPANRRHFDVVVACEDKDGEDLDVPLVSIRFR